MRSDVHDYGADRARIFALGLPPTLKVVMLALVEHMPNCRPSVARLAELAGVERKTVLRSLARLEQLGHIEVVRGNGMRNSYSFAWNRYQAVPSSPTIGTGTNRYQAVPSSPYIEDRYQNGTSPKSSPKQSQKQSQAVPKLGTRSRKQEAGESARTLSLPCEAPPEDYLVQADLEFTPRDQAKATWHHYWTEGLPPNGVERLYPWLLKQAREFLTRTVRSPLMRKAPEDDVIVID